MTSWWRSSTRAVDKGQLAIADVELAAYQFTDLCLAGFFRQRLFGYRTEPPSHGRDRRDS